MNVKQTWHRLFLEEQSSIGLALFRPFVAFTVGAHIIPTLVNLQDNYLSTAFKEKNPSFFTLQALGLVDLSPDWFVKVMVVVFLVSVFSFAVGFFSQIACIVMVIGCYYFYALNSLHIGTLSYDILLVVLFLMCLTSAHGDSFSVDAWRQRKEWASSRKRPIFLQRLLQLQIASTYFFTALCKFTAGGNWLFDNPMYNLYNSVPESVVKHFPFRTALASHPTLCYVLGLIVIGCEISLPFLLFTRRTRLFAIGMGWVFHILLLGTLHVPTIFFFLFPPQLLLFIEPEEMEAWFTKKAILSH